jgi:hypothetical protein
VLGPAAHFPGDADDGGPEDEHKEYDAWHHLQKPGIVNPTGPSLARRAVNPKVKFQPLF